MQNASRVERHSNALYELSDCALGLTGQHRGFLEFRESIRRETGRPLKWSDMTDDDITFWHTILDRWKVMSENKKAAYDTLFALRVLGCT